MDFEEFKKTLVPNAEMSVAEALNVKNSVNGYIRTCADILKRENSIASGNSRECDIESVKDNWHAAKAYLVDLQSAIMVANANSGACKLIKSIEELKDTASTLKDLDTRHGTHHVSTGSYDEGTVEKIFESFIRQSEVDSKVQQIELTIRSHENKLSELNREKILV
jgi:hypothetical protein